MNDAEKQAFSSAFAATYAAVYAATYGDGSDVRDLQAASDAVRLVASIAGRSAVHSLRVFALEDGRNRG